MIGGGEARGEARSYCLVNCILFTVFLLLSFKALILCFLISVYIQFLCLSQCFVAFF